MNQYGGIGALLALSQLTPEQFQTGISRFNEIRSNYQNLFNQVPSTASSTATAPAASVATAAQPSLTEVSQAEGTFGTGATPYTQPYYQSSFTSNPYYGGYGMGYQGMGYQPYGYSSYMPMSGRLSYPSYGGGYYGSAGKGGTGGKGGAI